MRHHLRLPVMFPVHAEFLLKMFYIHSLFSYLPPPSLLPAPLRQSQRQLRRNCGWSLSPFGSQVPKQSGQFTAHASESALMSNKADCNLKFFSKSTQKIIQPDQQQIDEKSQIAQIHSKASIKLREGGKMINFPHSGHSEQPG